MVRGEPEIVARLVPQLTVGLASPFLPDSPAGVEFTGGGGAAACEVAGQLAGYAPAVLPNCGSSPRSRAARMMKRRCLLIEVLSILSVMASLPYVVIVYWVRWGS